MAIKTANCNCTVTMKAIHRYTFLLASVTSVSVTTQDFGSAAPKVPWYATIQLKQFNQTVYYVQGAILDENTVLAKFALSTQLFNSAPDPNSLSFKNYMVYAGVYHVGSTNPHNISYIKAYPGGPRAKFAFLHLAPNFVGFALVYLASPIIFTSDIQPLCLPGVARTWLELAREFFPRPDRAKSFAVVLNWQLFLDLRPRVAWITMRDFGDCEEPFPPEEGNGEIFTCSLNVDTPGTVVTVRKMECVWRGIVALVGNQGNQSCGHGGEMQRHTYMGFAEEGLLVHSPGSAECGVLYKYTIDVPSPRVFQWIRQSVACGPWHYACNNGQCIPLNLACNGQTDCKDFSDEDASYCRAFKPCNPNTEFVCSNYGDCIPRVSNVTGKAAARCDGFVDCLHGEDEEHCTQVPESTGIKPLVAALIGAAVVLLTLLPVALLVWKRFAAPYRDLTEAEVKEFQDGRSDVSGICSQPYDTAYEYLDEECIRRHEIGRGNFGVVYLSLLGGQQVAEKVARSGKMKVEAFLSLLVEVKIMQHIERVGGHEGIVKFIGARTLEIKTRGLSFAMEYCALGNLQTYPLKNCAYFTEGSEPNVQLHEAQFLDPGSLTVDVLHRFNYGDQLHWCRQIASAMVFLESQNIAHGDLAARNVLLDKRRKAKLSDFGLAVQVLGGAAANREERGRGVREFPWRWAAPEVLENNGRLVMKSDVWSFGVLLWEIFSLGLEPWAELQLEKGAADLLPHLQSGALLGKPEHASDQVYALMCSCWKLVEEERPDFQALLGTLELMCHELYEANETANANV